MTAASNAAPTVTGRPKVSVCVITYNQRGFIGGCLDSLLAQRTSFDFEIVVGDDCSTDGTTDIVLAYQARHPQRIRAIVQPVNSGGQKNFLDVHAAARGEYVAHLDGDDLALPGKLQAQAAFLDSHPECNVCWHRMLIRNEATGVTVEDLIDLSLLPRDGIRREDLIRYCTIGLHSSKMYRARVGRFALPPFPVVDFYANVMQVGDGVARFVSSEPFGVYRTGIGIASGTKTRFLVAHILAHFGATMPQCRRAVTTAALLFALAALKNRRWRESLSFARVLARFFSPAGVLDLRRFWAVTKMLRMPATVRG